MLARKYENAAAGTALAARISINDFQGQALIDLMYADPATAEDPDQKAAIESLQSNNEIQPYEFSGYKGIAQHDANQLRAVVLKLSDDLIFEYDFGEGGLAPVGIDAYLAATNFAGIAETLEGHGFEASYMASEQGQNMFKDFSDSVGQMLDEQDAAAE